MHNEPNGLCEMLLVAWSPGTKRPLCFSLLSGARLAGLWLAVWLAATLPPSHRSWRTAASDAQTAPCKRPAKRHGWVSKREHIALPAIWPFHYKTQTDIKGTAPGACAFFRGNRLENIACGPLIFLTTSVTSATEQIFFAKSVWCVLWETCLRKALSR